MRKSNEVKHTEDTATVEQAATPVSRSLAGDPAPVYLTRNEVAARLGVSVHEIRRRESLGVMKPSGRDARGWILYSETDLANVSPTTRGARRPKPGGSFTVEEASRVFALLKEGRALVDIVCESAVHPDAVEAIASSYAKLSGAILVPAMLVERMNALEGKLDGVFPLDSAEAILDAVEAAVEEAKCKTCKRKPRTHCLGCGAEAAKRRVEG